MERVSRTAGHAVLHTLRAAANDELVRIYHAEAEQVFSRPPNEVFNAFSGWKRYQAWAPEVQGPGHWLLLRKGGVGSQFALYDKPDRVHLTHIGEVMECEPGRYFRWRAPFSEWKRAWIGSEVEFRPTRSGGTQVRERIYFEARPDQMPILKGFFATPSLNSKTMTSFLKRRLEGLSYLLNENVIPSADLSYPFDRDHAVAADWMGRIPSGDWVRILYADGELDFDGPPEVVFNAFSRFARYPDWTPMIHVGAEWLQIKAGGVGSRFLLWEKPGERQVMHDAVVTELGRNRKFAWRAPFAEWGKVFIGTAMTAEPRGDGGTHAYHVLYADIPEEYLPIFGGFGSLHGFDMQFETFHIFEEARGFNQLLQAGAFTAEDRSYLFDKEQIYALDWPMQEGRPWPKEALDLEPSRVMTYEDLMIDLSQILSDTMPSPAFMRRYRDLRRTWRYNADEAKRDWGRGLGPTS